jgi:sugar/nucleoside kinase (ribokinase family)
MFDIITVGHFSIDFIQLPKICVPKPTLGGPPTYVSIAAKNLNARVSVISNVGEDFPPRNPERSLIQLVQEMSS